jgi:hypothetical protein
MSSVFQARQLDDLVSLLGLPADDPAIAIELRVSVDNIKRYEEVGYIEYKGEGVSVIFEEARFQVGAVRAVGATLCLCAFHFHRHGHEGYEGYRGLFPNSVKLGDQAKTVESKMQVAPVRGGGGYSKMLRKPVPKWLRYDYKGVILQFQLDDKDAVEMVTLQIPLPAQRP